MVCGGDGVVVAHKIALDPNNRQRSYFARASGTARFAYNWALGEWQRQYRAGGKPTEMSLRVQLNGIKRQRFRWMLEVTKFAVEQAIVDLGMAFVHSSKSASATRASRKRACVTVFAPQWGRQVPICGAAD
jgi:putative transposase